MVYVALLRGINVGGKNKIEMAKLKMTFERLGVTHAKTYINSGNIIFQDDMRAQADLAFLLEKAIEADFGLQIKVLLRNFDEMTTVIKSLPTAWVNDQTMKCDVMFLWEGTGAEQELKELAVKPEIEDVKHISGAILWRADRKHAGKSQMLKLAGTKAYQHMTIRNCNTTRKIYELMQQ